MHPAHASFRSPMKICIAFDRYLDEMFGADNFCGTHNICQKTSASGSHTAAERLRLSHLVCQGQVEKVRSFERFGVQNPPMIRERLNITASNSQMADRRSMTGRRSRKLVLLPQRQLDRIDKTTLFQQRPARRLSELNLKGRRTARLLGTGKLESTEWQSLIDARRIEVRGKMLSYVRYFDDFPLQASEQTSGPTYVLRQVRGQDIRRSDRSRRS